MKASKTLIAGLALAVTLGAAPAMAAGGAAHPEAPSAGFSFEGPFGRFDQGQLQRGYKVYKEVCASCHSMQLLSFRDLGQAGGPFWYERYPNPNENPYVKAIAGEFEVNDIDNESGDTIKRKAVPADRFPSPYANAIAAAAANGGAPPPDLSVMAKARHGGARYIYSLLTGYAAVPQGLQIRPGQYYNTYMAGDLTPFMPEGAHVPAGGFIAMPNPLTDGQVTYDDDTVASVDQMAKDVAAFLVWTAEPKLDKRTQTGWPVLGFLLFVTILGYMAYRNIWADKKH